jgi:hypothetical protein
MEKRGAVYISWHPDAERWPRSPDEPLFQGHWEPGHRRQPDFINGPGWEDVEEAIAWGRERAPVVLVYLGSHEERIYSAGERYVGPPHPRWPPAVWPEPQDPSVIG